MQRVAVSVRRLAPVLLLLLLTVPPAAAKKIKREVPPDLPEVYRVWLVEVDVLMTDEEWETFLALTKDYQRDAFIERFWRERDPHPETARNELREEFDVLIETAREVFEDNEDPRFRIYLINGPPTHRVEIDCKSFTWPLELWFYLDGVERYGSPFALVFYRPWGVGRWRLWDPADGAKVLFDDVSFTNAPRGDPFFLGYDDPPLHCNLDALKEAFKLIGAVADSGGPFAYDKLMDTLARPRLPDSDEWALTFASYSTDLPAGVATFASTVAFAFPGWHGSRTLVQGLVSVPVEEVVAANLAGFESYDLIVNGEVLAGGKLFDSFRVRFDFAADEVSETLPLVFERYLRPGDYRMILRVEDLNGPRMARHEVGVTVPEVERPAPPTDSDPEVRRVLDEAYEKVARGETSIEILRPIGDLLTGLQRFDALVTGGRVAGVVFTVDGDDRMVKKRPPYSVELDLGPLPRTHLLRATAYDAGGDEIASHELLVNASPYRFSVRLVEPVAGKTYRHGLRARADVSVPQGETLERLELYRGDERLVTLYQEPFSHPIPLAGDEVALVRAAAYLTDGTMAEDVVIVNSPAPGEEIDVDFVELYTTVSGRDGRPVLGLEAADFSVFEDGVAQTVERFEKVDDLPIHAVILLDVSASMEGRLAAARDAALDFFAAIVKPADRLAAITFNDRPVVAAELTSEIERFARGLAGLKAERGTALYDSLVYSLFYTNGLGGQRPVLLLSDGVDESSRFTFDETLDYLRRSGVTIYAIGLELEGGGRRTLKRFAEETGGQSFFLDDVAGLSEVYATIREELRTKYLLAYQSSDDSGSDDFRRVEVRMSRRGLEARTIRGYYP